MENLVPCKRCSKEFNYVPGPAGNFRQLCNDCRIIADQEEVEQFKEELVVENNKYLIGAKGRKDIYDPLDILLNGNIPTFDCDADKFICAIEFGDFINRNGFANKIENVIKFIQSLGLPHATAFVKRWNLERMEAFMKHPLALEEWQKQMAKANQE